MISEWILLLLTKITSLGCFCQTTSVTKGTEMSINQPRGASTVRWALLWPMTEQHPLLLLQRQDAPWNTGQQWLQWTRKCWPSIQVLKEKNLNVTNPCDRFSLLVGLSLKARLKYLGRSFPSASPAVSNTWFSDQKNSIPSVQSDTHIKHTWERFLPKH